MRSRSPFSSSEQVFLWIESFTNYEKIPSSRPFRLDRMEALAELSGHPEGCAPVIHVAGSKGKGSVSTIIASLLQKAGFITGRYLSPHVSDYRERVGLADRFFEEHIYCSAGEELRQIVTKAQEAYPQLFDPTTGIGEPPTFFELCTLLFFLSCRQAQVDIMVVEVGMGGRLDATNIVTPLASVITPIELEHTTYLGNTIAAIAGEKAGIIKREKPVILSPQQEEALSVFQSIAQERQAPLYYLPEIVVIEDIHISSKGTQWTWKVKEGETVHLWPEKLRTSHPILSIPLIGEVQAWNTLQALATLYRIFPNQDWTALLSELSSLSLPARFERISEHPEVILDGAHTPRSITFCLTTFCSLYGEGNVLLFGCAADKDVESMANILAPHFSEIILSQPGTFKKSDLPRMEAAFRKNGSSFKTVAETTTAINLAIRTAQEKGKALLVCGSFYLAAEARKYILGTTR
ncbi:MAG: Mur ligase family protein [Treponemataceae bacterium]|nr:Mur ligase family protein [Treponemataceae bacterium]